MDCVTHYKLPPSGSLIRLNKIPRGSWATAGETYRVLYAPHQKGGRKGIFPTTSIRLWNEDRGCGTYDSAMNWATAEWELV